MIEAHPACDPVTVMREAFSPIAGMIRSATDLVDPATFPEVIKPERRAVAASSCTSLASTSTVSETAIRQAPTDGLSTRNTWASDSLQVLRKARKAAKDADLEAVRVAEMLIPHFAALPSQTRPQVTVDDDGRPGFGTSTGSFYIDLTIESHNALTWYAVVDEREFFADSVAFDGRRLPDDLRSLFEVRR